MTLNRVHFFESSQNLPGIFDSLFGGFFLLKGMPLLGQLGILFFLAVACGTAVASVHQPGKWRRASMAASLAVFTLAWLFLLQPWDEIFINLKHARNWSETGRFSFNRFTWDEGTVDFLPYWLVGVAGRCGAGLLESAWLASYAGGVACLLLLLRIFRQARLPQAEPFFFLALCLYPPLVYNSASAFSATLFCAVLLTAVLHLYFGGRAIVGLGCLAILPLVRVEGAFASLLLVGGWAWRTHRRHALVAVPVLLPAAVHALIRWRVYGHAIPLPIQFKSSLGSPFYFAVGMRNLVADLTATHVLCLVLVLVVLFQAGPSRRKVFANEVGAFPLLGGLLAIFTIPYYLSGGDWFPSYWGRYLLPFSLVTFTATAVALVRAVPLMPTDRQRWLAVPALFFVVSSLWPISSTWKGVEQVFSHRRTLAMIHEPTIARGHFRVQHLSQLGEHLRRTTEPADRIGSSELATVMYFAERDAVDYLGLINPTIAGSPLRVLPSLIRRFPYRSELPYLIFKRLRPDQLEKTLPEVLYTFDFILRDQNKSVRAYELDGPELFKALSRWETQLGGLIDDLYGGLAHIQQLGYEPVVVRSGEDFVGLYFVHRRILARHLQALKAAGYRGGTISYSRPAAPYASEAVDRKERP